MAGGSTSVLPVAKFFDEKEPRKSTNPNEATAHGAAQRSKVRNATCQWVTRLLSAGL